MNNFLKISTLFLATAMLIGSCSPEQRANSSIKDAEKLIAANKFNEAYNICSKELQIVKTAEYPQAIAQQKQLLKQLSEIEIKREKYWNALNYLKDLAKLVDQEEAYKIQLQITDIYEQDLHLMTEALFSLRNAVRYAEQEQKAELDSLYIHLMKLLFKLGRYEQVRGVSYSFMENCPESSRLFECQLMEANSFFIQEEYKKAAAIYRFLLETDLTAEQRGIVYFELGSCSQMLSEQKEALGYYKLSLAGHPNPQMVQHHIIYLQALVDNADVEKEIKRSKLEQAWLNSAHPDNINERDLIMK